MKIEPKTLKGFRDFLPKEARKRTYVLNALKKVFESYGFEPLETPVLEYEEILLGKYGDEGDKLMYRFEDNGQRKVAMRYDQTVPLARVVAQYANDLPLPFKRYQIQNVYRADNTQKGRYREFLQVDVDSVGSKSNQSDTEIVSLIINSFNKLGFKNFKVLINDRSVFEGLDKKAISIIDKLAKIGEDGVRTELKSNGFDPNLMDEIANKAVPENIKMIIDQMPESVEFSPTLARGLDYYTGLILEVVDLNYSAGSLGGGGRYDELIGMFSNQSVPAVGFAFGFDRIIEAMEEQNLFDGVDLGGTKILVTSGGSEIAELLRNKGINAEFYTDEKDLDKQLRYADRKGIPYVLISGQTLKLKNMQTGETREGSLDELVSNL